MFLFETNLLIIILNQLVTKKIFGFTHTTIKINRIVYIPHSILLLVYIHKKYFTQYRHQFL